MMTNGKIGVALVGGYLLGRTKKAKMAIGLGMFLAGKRLRMNPQELGRLVAGSPVLSGLNDQVRKELVDATKSAMTSALTKRVNGIADSLHERTLDLGRPGGRRDGRDDRDDDPYAEEEYDDGVDDEPEAEPAPRRKAPARAAKPAAKAASGTRRAASGEARKTASRARKSTGTARKTATGARKTVSGTVRKATDRGGRNG